MALLSILEKRNMSRANVWKELQELDNRISSISINAQIGTAYTLVITDVNKLITMSNASANTLTVPLNSAVAFPIGTQILVEQEGTGVTTIASGATLHSAGGLLDLASQYSTVTLIKKATDIWLVAGDLA